jgi:hypothetical protein
MLNRQFEAPLAFHPPRATPEVETRSRELLLSKLTPEQRDTFDKNNWFVVVGGKTKTLYRVEGHTLVANIVVLVAAVHRLCGHCNRSLPMADQLLAQKLMLEYDEEEFLKIANRHAA